MNRGNYGRKSGVIVDLCREHGVWFDAEELDRVLLWLRRGGAERAARLAAEQERWERRAPSQVPVAPMPLGGDRWDPGWDGRWGFIGYLVDLVIGEVGDWFVHR
jgi:hypothetical protein